MVLQHRCRGMPLTLLADRFLRQGRRWFDISTAERSRLSVPPAGSLQDRSAGPSGCADAGPAAASADQSAGRLRRRRRDIAVRGLRSARVRSPRRPRGSVGSRFMRAAFWMPTAWRSASSRGVRLPWGAPNASAGARPAGRLRAAAAACVRTVSELLTTAALRGGLTPQSWPARPDPGCGPAGRPSRRSRARKATCRSVLPPSSDGPSSSTPSQAATSV